MSASPRNTAPPVPPLDLIEGIYAVGKTLPPASPARAIITVTIGATIVNDSTAPHIETSESDEARLIRLGAKFEALRRREVELLAARPIDEPALEAFFEEIDLVARLIEQVPVTTLQGLKVKANVVDWCLDGQGTEDDTTDVRMSVAIAKDILRIC